MHKYRLKYLLESEHGAFSKEELGEEWGGTEALILFSLLYPSDGSFSVNSWSWDGRNESKELPDAELFKVWSLLTLRLAKSETLDEDRREFARHVFEAIRAGMGPVGASE